MACRRSARWISMRGPRIIWTRRMTVLVKTPSGDSPTTATRSTHGPWCVELGLEDNVADATRGIASTASCSARRIRIQTTADRERPTLCENVEPLQAPRSPLPAPHFRPCSEAPLCCVATWRRGDVGIADRPRLAWVAKPVSRDCRR